MAAESPSARPEAGAVNADFRDLIQALLGHDVRFLVVGGIALAAHGLPRVTGDMDVWVRPDAANAERVYAALVAFALSAGSSLCRVMAAAPRRARSRRAIGSATESGNGAGRGPAPRPVAGCPP